MGPVSNREQKDVGAALLRIREGHEGLGGSDPEIVLTFLREISETSRMSCLNAVTPEVSGDESRLAKVPIEVIKNDDAMSIQGEVILWS